MRNKRVRPTRRGVQRKHRPKFTKKAFWQMVEGGTFTDFWQMMDYLDRVIDTTTGREKDKAWDLYSFWLMELAEYEKNL